jgi:branched-chain amino acid aminotransferase
VSDVKYMSLDGKLVAAQDARIHILSPAVKYATNVFEGIRGYWNPAKNQMFLFRLTEHLERMRFSMKVMRYGERFTVARMRDAILELIRANDTREDTYVRLYAFVDAPDGEMTATEPVRMAIAATPRGGRGRDAKGAHCAVSSWARIADHSLPPRIKCVANYNNGRLAWLQAKADGYDNTILLTQAGKVSEGPGACVFLVRDGTPVTPSVTSDILESVTRRTLIEIFPEAFDRVVVEREVGRTELYAAEEAFFCGTGHEILPILSVDRHPVGDGEPGPVTAAVKQRYFAMVRGEIDDRPEWRTPVFAG